MKFASTSPVVEYRSFAVANPTHSVLVIQRYPFFVSSFLHHGRSGRYRREICISRPGGRCNAFDCACNSPRRTGSSKRSHNATMLVVTAIPLLKGFLNGTRSVYARITREISVSRRLRSSTNRWECLGRQREITWIIWITLVLALCPILRGEFSKPARRATEMAREMYENKVQEISERSSEKYAERS